MNLPMQALGTIPKVEYYQMPKSQSERKKSMYIFTCLQVAIVVLLGYLLIGELSPRPTLESFVLFQAWNTQQLVLILLASLFVALVASISYKNINYTWKPFDWHNAFPKFLWFLNVVPNILAGISVCWYCEADVASVTKCDYVYTILDSIGVISARLARLECGLILLLSMRGEATWLFGLSNGFLGYAESIPLHRTLGWWCAFQSVLHGLVYFIFYFHNGGWKQLWIACFPVDKGDNTSSLNRLGLVNFFGVVGLLVFVPLGITAMQKIRQRYYHIFQTFHVPLSSLFLLFACLHDLPMLWFAIPGLACWCFGKLMWCRRQSNNNNNNTNNKLLFTPRLYEGNAKILNGTSGPWVEINVNVGSNFGNNCFAPIGKWVLMRVVPLGREMHPLSVVTTENGVLTTIVSAKAGNWSKCVATLAQSAEEHFKVEIEGPFPTGGGHWSWESNKVEAQQALLLIAGGAGLYGWLPGLATASSSGRPCHLIWCVKSEGDYHVLKDQLPHVVHIGVTVYITRSENDKYVNLFRNAPEHIKKRIEQTSENRLVSRGAFCLLFTPLAATFSGVVVSWFWLLYARSETIYMENLSMIEYIVQWRLLPIIYIMVAIGIVCVASSVFLRICISYPDIKADDYKPLPPCQIDGPGPTHEIKNGRPDIVSIIRKSSANVESQELVVASCGPTSLVKHVEEVVKSISVEFPDKRLEFSGTLPNW